MHMFTMDQMDDGQQEVIALADANTKRLYITVAVFCLYAYDILLTIEQEREHVWKAQRSVGKMCYLLVRWPWFIIACLSCYAAFMPAPSIMFCQQEFMLENFIGVFEVGICQYVMALRTWILYCRNKWVGIVLFPLPILYVVTMVVLNAIYLPRLTPVSENLIPGIFVGCNRDWSNYFTHHTAHTFLPLIVFNVLILAFTLAKAVVNSRNQMKTPILQQLYQDGFLFFLTMFAYTVIAVLICGWIDSPFETMLALLRTLNGVLICRLILNIKGVPQELRDASRTADEDRTAVIFMSPMPSPWAPEFNPKEYQQLPP